MKKRQILNNIQQIAILVGRIDRKIEFPLPDQKTKRRIFNIHTNRMTLSEDVNLEEYILSKDDLSGADVKVGLSFRFFSPSTMPLYSIIHLQCHYIIMVHRSLSFLHY